MIRHLLLACTLLWLCACSDLPKTEATSPETVAPHPVITAHVEAFNAQDAAAMSQLQHPDIEWFSVNGSDMELAVKGREDLAEEMKNMFTSPIRVRGDLRDWSMNGNYVAVTETASWTNKKGEAKAQSALTVYEMEDGLIRRVYYYPTVNN